MAELTEPKAPAPETATAAPEPAPEAVDALASFVLVDVNVLESWANVLARATVDIMGGLPERALTAIRATIYGIENAEIEKGEAE